MVVFPPATMHLSEEKFREAAHKASVEAAKLLQPPHK